MRSPPLGPPWEDITLPDQVIPRRQKASSTRHLKPQSQIVTSLMSLLAGEANVFRQCTMLLSFPGT